MPLNLHSLRSRHRAAILTALGRYGIDHVKVFGSVARGEANESSDLDLLIENASGLGLKIIRLERELGETLGMPVQLLTEKGLSPLLRERILAEAVML
jgi:predicted nucleotidyltransferase